LIEAAKRGFDLVIGGELSAFRLSKAFQDGGQMRRIDGLRLSLVTGQGEHGLRDFVLATGGNRRTASRAFPGAWSWPIICDVQAKMEGAGNVCLA
jgi:hypothetical protein